jgi:hypothetical protein
LKTGAPQLYAFILYAAKIISQMILKNKTRAKKKQPFSPGH